MSVAPVCSLAAAPDVVKCVILGMYVSVVRLLMRLYPFLVQSLRQVHN